MLKKRIYDNSNLNESYSGVVSPMTFSFISRVYAQVYMQFCSLLGVSEKEISTHKDAFSQMLAYIGGRAYYQLHNWHIMISLLPGYSWNGRFLEEMMGIPAKEMGEIKVEKNSHVVFENIKIIYLSLRMAFILAFMDAFIYFFNFKFMSSIKKAEAEIENSLNDIVDIKQVMVVYRHLESEFTKDFRVPIANDLAVMIASGLIKAFCRKEYGVKGEQIANSLIGGNQGLKSVEPAIALNKLIYEISANTSLNQYFKKHTSSECLDLIDSDPRFKAVKLLFNGYVDKYGSRVPGELKLESLSFLDDPKSLIELIRHNIKIRPVSTNVSADQSILLDRPPLVLRFLSHWVRKSVSHREQTRFQRTLAFNLVRQLLNKLGKHLIDINAIADARDIYYLTIEELEKFNATINYQKIISDRKQKEQEFKQVEMPRRISTNDSVIDYRRFAIKTKSASKWPLTGIVACYGKNLETIYGKALVLKNFDPKCNYSDKILITTQTDPGWTIVFPSLKALIVERGGTLSHAAIVSREFNLPCLIGVVGATEVIKTEDEIVIDLHNLSVNAA